MYRWTRGIGGEDYATFLWDLFVALTGETRPVAESGAAINWLSLDTLCYIAKLAGVSELEKPSGRRKRRKAAGVIQARMRGKQARSKRKHKAKAAVAIQSGCRGVLARRATKAATGQKKAATAIQSRFRGQRGRKLARQASTVGSREPFPSNPFASLPPANTPSDASLAADGSGRGLHGGQHGGAGEHYAVGHVGHYGHGSWDGVAGWDDVAGWDGVARHSAPDTHQASRYALGRQRPPSTLRARLEESEKQQQHGGRSPRLGGGATRAPIHQPRLFTGMKLARDAVLEIPALREQQLGVVPVKDEAEEGGHLRARRDRLPKVAFLPPVRNVGEGIKLDPMSRAAAVTKSACKPPLGSSPRTIEPKVSPRALRARMHELDPRDLKAEIKERISGARDARDWVLRQRQFSFL